MLTFVDQLGDRDDVHVGLAGLHLEALHDVLREHFRVFDAVVLGGAVDLVAEDGRAVDLVVLDHLRVAERRRLLLLRLFLVPLGDALGLDVGGLEAVRNVRDLLALLEVDRLGHIEGRLAAGLALLGLVDGVSRWAQTFQGGLKEAHILFVRQ